MSLFAGKLKELRIEKGLTQKELAQVLKMGQSTICDYEKGKVDPTASAIILIADFFDVSTDYLLGREK